ncbi:MAG: DUF4097 family beta strand repeat-containing protein [Bryobacteraceae bacterium]
MRRRSITGPLILVLVGALFLINNLRPELPLWELVAVYWPFLLIAWGALRVAEVFWSYLRHEPLPRGLGGAEIVLIVFVSLIGTGMFSAHHRGIRLGVHGLEMFGEQYDYSIAAEKPLPAGAVRVIVDNLRGNVKVTGADAQEIRVSGRKNVRALGRSEADHADRKTPVDIVNEGGAWVVRTNQDRIDNNQRIAHDLEITVPRTASVTLRGRSGDYDALDVASVDIDSERGDARIARIPGNVRVEIRRSDLVRATDVKGNVDLQGRGSDVELSGIAGQVVIAGSFSGTLEFKNLAKPLRFESQNTDLRVEGVPGQLSMDLGEFTARNVAGPIRLVTKSKDIRIEDFTQSLEVETERGDIEISPVRLPVPKIDARSRTGKIDLTLPARANFELQASTEQGEAINEFGPALQTEAQGRAASLKGKVGQGPPIHLSTQRGTVSVKKAGTVPAQAQL